MALKNKIYLVTTLKGRSMYITSPSRIMAKLGTVDPIVKVNVFKRLNDIKYE